MGDSKEAKDLDEMLWSSLSEPQIIPPPAGESIDPAVLAKVLRMARVSTDLFKWLVWRSEADGLTVKEGIGMMAALAGSALGASGTDPTPVLKLFLGSVGTAQHEELVHRILSQLSELIDGASREHVRLQFVPFDGEPSEDAPLYDQFTFRLAQLIGEVDLPPTEKLEMLANLTGAVAANIGVPADAVLAAVRHSHTVHTRALVNVRPQGESGQPN